MFLIVHISIKINNLNSACIYAMTMRLLYTFQLHVNILIIIVDIKWAAIKQYRNLKIKKKQYRSFFFSSEKKSYFSVRNKSYTLKCFSRPFFQIDFPLELCTAGYSWIYFW